MHLTNMEAPSKTGPTQELTWVQEKDGGSDGRRSVQAQLLSFDTRCWDRGNVEPSWTEGGARAVSELDSLTALQTDH